MDYQISALELDTFSKLFGQDNEALLAVDIQRMTVTDKPGIPCRITLEDAEIGESVLLLNYEHQSAASPFRSSHALFVRETATASANYVNENPELLRIRQLSVRSFDAAGMMVDADICDGGNLEALIERLLSDASAEYLHVHNAARGCYLARVDRFN